MGNVRQVELNQLWIQDKVVKGEIEVRRVKGEDNRADALTKYADQRQVGQQMELTRQTVERGRHQLAPEIEN